MSEDKVATSRRDFLKLASVTAPAVAVVTATGARTMQATAAGGSGGFQMTEHVKKYLDSARF